MNTPTRDELGVGESPDVLHLITSFLGKSREQAFAMFSGETGGTRGAYWTEDFTYMEPVGFEYYLEPASRYLHGDESTGDWEFATGMLVSLAAQMRWGRLPRDVQVQVRDLANYLRANHVKFDLDLDEFDRQRFAEIGVDFK